VCEAVELSRFFYFDFQLQLQLTLQLLLDLELEENYCLLTCFFLRLDLCSEESDEISEMLLQLSSFPFLSSDYCLQSVLISFLSFSFFHSLSLSFVFSFYFSYFSYSSSSNAFVFVFI